MINKQLDVILKLFFLVDVSNYNLLSNGMRGLEKMIASKIIYVLKCHKISYNKETFLKIK